MVLTLKPFSLFYYNETVQCRGMKGDSVELQQTVCVQYLEFNEVKVYGSIALLVIGK